MDCRPEPPCVVTDIPKRDYVQDKFVFINIDVCGKFTYDFCNSNRLRLPFNLIVFKGIL